MPLDLTRIRALCFDVDGTLSDTDDLWVQQFERLLLPLRLFLPDPKVRTFARWTVMGMETPGNILYHLLDRAGLDDEVAGVYNWIARIQDSRGGQPRRPHSFLLIPLMQEVLRQLQQRFPMAVVSARDRRSTAAFLEQFELSPLFQAVATSQTCSFTKPYPDPVVWAARQMNVEPHECLMIGDTTVDIRAGKAAGAQTVGVLCGFGGEKELLRAGADLVLPVTSSLLDILLPEVAAPAPSPHPTSLSQNAPSLEAGPPQQQTNLTKD
jgi:phosphoglycolate phosphatase-like HAD superfamily hydrolase